MWQDYSGSLSWASTRGGRSLTEWAGFFAASAGAAAGLTGLIIVAMSVNIGTIIARAGATIAALVLAVVSSYRVLDARGTQPVWAVMPKNLVVLVQVAPFLVGGVLLVADHPAGLGWIAAGSLSVFVGSVLNAWVLLVEILR